MAQLKQRIKALNDRYEAIQETVVQTVNAPQHVQINGIGSLTMKVNTTYVVNKTKLLAAVSEKVALDTATWSAASIKKGVNTAKYAKLEASGVIVKSTGKVSYAFTPLKKSKD